MHWLHTRNRDDTELGYSLLAKGEVVGLLAAGGQGTRLGLPGSKGLFPITPVLHRTLLQYFIERAKALGERVGNFPPLCIMTSPLNHEEIASYLRENQFFGYPETHLFLFPQPLLPFLDEEGNETKEKGPTGNGAIFYALQQAGLLEKFSQSTLFSFAMIDNPLGDPFDPVLLSFHAKHKLDIAIKCIEKASDEEKVGLVLGQPKVHIVEYTDLTEEQKAEEHYANISLLTFSRSCVETAAKNTKTLPFHKHFKAIPGTKKKGYKREWFIFDHLRFAKNIQALLYPREEVFAPLKQLHGKDSPDEVQQQLQAFDQKILSRLTERENIEGTFELHPAFYYPDKQLKALCCRQKGPFAGWITPSMFL